MGCLGILVTLTALLGADPQQEAPAPVLERTFPLEGVRGPADGTGIPGRLDHMAYDPATGRLFVACVANGSLEAIDLESGERVGTVAGLRGPQGVAVVGDAVYVATGDDGEVHRFDVRTLTPGRSAPVGADADNVRVDRDDNLWVSFGGEGPGGFVCFAPETLQVIRRFDLPRMPEGFQLDPTGPGVFANVPAGKRSSEDGSVFALSRPDGELLWEQKFSGRAGNFPMTLDPEHGRVFVVSREPALLIGLDARDGSILGEAACPPQSDDLFYDARSGRVAVIGGGALPTPGNPGGTGAALDLFDIDASGRPTLLSRTPLPPHCRTGKLVDERRTLYIAVPGTQDRPAEVREYRLPD